MVWVSLGQKGMVWNVLHSLGWFVWVWNGFCLIWLGWFGTVGNGMVGMVIVGLGWFVLAWKIWDDFEWFGIFWNCLRRVVWVCRSSTIPEVAPRQFQKGGN